MGNDVQSRLKRSSLYEPQLRGVVAQYIPPQDFFRKLIKWVVKVQRETGGGFVPLHLMQALPLENPLLAKDRLLAILVPREPQDEAALRDASSWGEVVTAYVWIALLNVDDPTWTAAEAAAGRNVWAERIGVLERALTQIVSEPELKHAMDQIPPQCSSGGLNVTTPMDAAEAMVELLLQRVAPRKSMLSAAEWNAAAQQALRVTPPAIVNQLTVLNDAYLVTVVCWQKWARLSREGRKYVEVMVADALLGPPHNDENMYAVSMANACQEIGYMMSRLRRK